MSANLAVRITLQMLHDTLAALPLAVRENKATDSFSLAAAILKHYFSPEWLNANLNNKGFLWIDEADQNSKDASVLRMIDLAEVIYNLQLVQGFDDCIARMRDGDIEGTFAELDLGRMLFLNSVPFRYIKPQGVKGKYYNVEVIYPDGVVACADAKCALENSDLREKSIGNKLEKARLQLPPDQPGIIFVKTPPKWMQQASARNHPVFRCSELNKLSMNCPTEVATRACVNRGAIRFFTSRSDDAQSSSVCSIDASAMP